MKLTLLCWLSSAALAGALDFNYRWVEARGEGGSYRYLEFRDAENWVTYLPPKGWRVTGSRQALRLIPPEAAGVQIELTIGTLKELPTMDPTQYPAWEKIARQALPEGATDVALFSSGAGPQVDGRDTCEVILSYSFFGSRITDSRLYATRGNELLCFRASCPSGGFQKYRAEFHTSLHSFAGT